MSVAGGTFGTSRHIRGGSRSIVPSKYLIGFWPCQQAEGDVDETQVTDISGKGAHASIGALTTAQAWANAGYFTSRDVAQNRAWIPIAKWPHRFAAHSLLVNIQSNVTIEASSEAILGNRDTTTASGFALTVTSAGRVQWAFTNPSNTFFGASTTATPYASAARHTIFGAYDVVSGLCWIGVDGVLDVVANGLVSKANIVASDSPNLNPVGIGGRGGTGQNGSIAGTHRFFQAYSVDGPLPANLAALCLRLHMHPFLPLTIQDLGA